MVYKKIITFGNPDACLWMWQDMFSGYVCVLLQCYAINRDIFVVSLDVYAIREYFLSKILFLCTIFNKHDVAGAVLKSLPVIINSEILQFKYLANWRSLGAELLRECSAYTMCHVSHVTCHMSHVTYHMVRVTCHVSHVTCHVSPVTCHMSKYLLFYIYF